MVWKRDDGTSWIPRGRMLMTCTESRLARGEAIRQKGHWASQTFHTHVTCAAEKKHIKCVSALICVEEVPVVVCPDGGLRSVRIVRH